MESSKSKRRPRITETRHQIPEGIIIEILSRLPVNSLLRFKCVSKPWRSLISSKYFIKTHIKHSKNNKTFPHHSIISVCCDGRMNSCPMYPLLTQRFTHAPPLNLSKTFILGSCNGLICVGADGLFVGSRRFSLWNIATKKSKELPDFFAGVEDLDYCCISKYGFGFDESSGDYKVFALFDVFYCLCPILSSIGRVYSLKANSWGETKAYDDGPPFEGTFEKVGKFASGKLHWVRETESKWEIVYLDLKSESFGVVEKPSFMEDDFARRLGVNFDGCLCLFCECPNRLDMWIWNKYGAEDSWVKFASIPYSLESWKPSFLSTPSPHASSRPLCMLPNGEVLFTYRTSEFLSDFLIYNPKDNGFRPRYIDSFEDVDQVEVYTESLVSLVSDDADGEGEACLGIME